MEGIYLDNNATTKIDDRVFVAMRPYLTNHFAHPSSPHPLGTKVREKIEQARDSVAVLLGTSHPDEIVFTSGGTESINTAIKGVLAAAPTRNRIVTTKVEHISDFIFALSGMVLVELLTRVERRFDKRPRVGAAE